MPINLFSNRNPSFTHAVPTNYLYSQKSTFNIKRNKLKEMWKKITLEADIDLIM